MAASDPTLAQVSAMAVEEQIRIGWMDNPAIDTLYSMTSSGVWVARTDASGQQKVLEASGADILDASKLPGRWAARLAMEGVTDLSTASISIVHLAPTACVGGALGAQALLGAPGAGYKVVPLEVEVYVDTDTGLNNRPTGNVTIEDSDGAVLGYGIAPGQTGQSYIRWCDAAPANKGVQITVDAGLETLDVSRISCNAVMAVIPT